MHDLDRAMDTLAAEITARTRAPGALLAVRRARRRRATAAAAAALVLVSVGGGLVSVLAAHDRVSLIEGPAAPSTQPSVVQESAQARPLTPEAFRQGVEETLVGVDGWTLNDSDPSTLRPCDGDWAAMGRGGSAGNFDIPSAGVRRRVWSERRFFLVAAQAEDAVAALAGNLASCPTLSWRVEPIGRTGVLLASSWLGVAWIYQQGATVDTLQVPTVDGPPPLDVQVDIANLIIASTG